VPLDAKDVEESGKGEGYSTTESLGGQMVKCGPAGMRASSLGLVGLGLRVRDKVRVSVRDRVGVRVSDGVRISTFYFLLQ